MKVRGVATRKGDTPEYIKRMQQELFDALAKAKSRAELRLIEPEVQEVRRRYFEALEDADVGDLAIRRRVSRLTYSHRCAEASAAQAYRRQGITLAPGMVISYVVKDTRRWGVEPARVASAFDAEYYEKLLEKAWGEAAFVFEHTKKLDK